jgi:predicted O-methyltransferase YrrM
VDFLFIDGDHTYEGVKQDFETFSSLVVVGGVIALHDVCDHSLSFPDCKVRRFWEEIKDKYEWKEFIGEPNTWGGIGMIIQKAAEEPYVCVDNAK